MDRAEKERTISLKLAEWLGYDYPRVDHHGRVVYDIFMGDASRFGRVFDPFFPSIDGSFFFMRCLSKAVNDGAIIDISNDVCHVLTVKAKKYTTVVESDNFMAAVLESIYLAIGGYKEWE